MNKISLTNQDVGRLGEFFTEQFLWLHEFEILHKNWRIHHLEIDIVARNQTTIHIVEVKTRLGNQVPDANRFDQQKKRSLRKAAHHYLIQNTFYNCNVQFDLVKVYGSINSAKIEYLPDVFFPGLQ